MNPTLRRGIPWAVALVLHAALVFVPVRLGMAPRARPEERRIDLVFDQPAPRAPVAAARLPARETVELPAGAAPSLPRASAVPPLPSTVSGPAAPLDDRLVELAAESTAPYPSPRAVLADLPAPSTASDTAAPAAAAAQALADVSSAQPTVVWQGAGRRMIRRPMPEFPQVMSRAGQEGEFEAQLTFSPAGTVTRVEVVRSSGYPDIDARYTAVLRTWLAGQSPGRTDTATVGFRFRLEARD